MHKTRRGLELGADFLSQCGAIKTGHAHQIACPYVSLARRLCRPLQQVSQRVGFERHRSFSAVLASVKTHGVAYPKQIRSEEHTSELQSRGHLVCRLLLEK